MRVKLNHLPQIPKNLKFYYWTPEEMELFSGHFCVDILGPESEAHAHSWTDDDNYGWICFRIYDLGIIIHEAAHFQRRKDGHGKYWWKRVKFLCKQNGYPVPPNIERHRNWPGTKSRLPKHNNSRGRK